MNVKPHLLMSLKVDDITTLASRDNISNMTLNFQKMTCIILSVDIYLYKQCRP